MKVIISENESYELGIPNEISFSDFCKLVQKLNVVVSMLKGETSAKQISAAKKPIKYTREIAIEILTEYYRDKNSHQFAEICKKYDTSLSKVQGAKHKWVKAYDLKPEDVGTQEFIQHIDRQP